MSFHLKSFLIENAWLFITIGASAEIIFFLLVFLQYFSGVMILPLFFTGTIEWAIVIFILLFNLIIIGGDWLYNFLLDAIKFLSLDHDASRTEFKHNYGHWLVRYLLFSSLYFTILMINFNFSGYKNEGILMFLPWFGLLFLRVLHHFNGNIGKELGKFVIYLFIPLGALDVIAHVIFLQEIIIFEKWPVFICVGLSFVFATLMAEAIIKFFKHILIEVRYWRFPPKNDLDDYELGESLLNRANASVELIPIKIMESDACPGNPPKKIGIKDVSVHQILGKKCFKLIKFKNSPGGPCYIIPQSKNGMHVTYHPKEIHLKNNDCYSNIDIDSVYETHQFFTRLKSSCFCIRIGRKIDEEDLNKIIPLLIKFLPGLNIEESTIKNQLLKNRFILFHVND